MLQSMRANAKYIWWFVVLTFVVVFVFAQTSGLLGRAPVTAGTAVATVDGQDITYQAWVRSAEAQINQQEQQSGQSLSLDDQSRIRKDVFDQMVMDILLDQAYKRHGITVTANEIRQAALDEPYPQFMQDPQFQTNGQFDIAKYRRFLASPAAREQGILAQLEAYYRAAIPRQKLFDQIAATVSVSDARLWSLWQDAHDSAQVSYVALPITAVPDSAVSVSAAEIAQYFAAHRAQFGKQPGRAVLTVAMLPRRVTAADSAAALHRADSLRQSIVHGAKFADVARHESADSASAAQGGLLGPITPGGTVPHFEKAAYALKPGQISQPVLSRFGYHLIEVDSRKGDTLTVRHILIPIQQTDSSAAVTDRLADSLSKVTGSRNLALFDRLSKTLRLTTGRAAAVEGQPLVWHGAQVPGVSAWAFTATPGMISDLIDTPEAYYVARLDSLQPGGTPTLAMMRSSIRAQLLAQKKIARLEPRARRIIAAVAAGKTLEQAARGEGLTVARTGVFTRGAGAPGLGQANQAVGAAFSLPVGAVRGPIDTPDGVFVLRVDHRVEASRAAWEKQKATERTQILQRMRQQRVEEYLAELRRSATIVDRRKAIERQNQQAAS